MSKARTFGAYAVPTFEVVPCEHAPHAFNTWLTRMITAHSGRTQEPASDFAHVLFSSHDDTRPHRQNNISNPPGPICMHSVAPYNLQILTGRLTLHPRPESTTLGILSKARRSWWLTAGRSVSDCLFRFRLLIVRRVKLLLVSRSSLKLSGRALSNKKEEGKEEGGRWVPPCGSATSRKTLQTRV